MTERNEMTEPGRAPERPPMASAAAPPKGGALALLDAVKRRERQMLAWLGGCLAASMLLVLVPLAGWLAPLSVRWGRVALVLAPLAALGALALVAWRLKRAVGDPSKTARLLSQTVPGVTLELLAAVELSRALGERHDFSPALAKAFLDGVDARVGTLDPRALVDPKPLRRGALGTLAAALFAVVLLGASGARVKDGLGRLVTPAPQAALVREPITGDFELTYRYPAYTGLEPRTVVGSDGSIVGPAGTELVLKTRADRDVEGAALVVNGARVPLTVKERQLQGSLVLQAPGHYHVVFLDGTKVVAEGPDLPIQVEVDSPPQPRILSPADGLEVQGDALKVSVRFEVSDDYGVSQLALVYRVQSGKEQRVALHADEGRVTRGQYGWDLSGLKLEPGNTVAYWLEAKDTDTVKGPKKGTSKTQRLTLYSAAEHRKVALEKTEKLWERLVTQLADRMEGPDRALPLKDTWLTRGKDLDAKETQLASDFLGLAEELDKDKDPPVDIMRAVEIVGGSLLKDGSMVSAQRKMMERFAKQEPETARRLSAGLVSAVTKDTQHTENNVLYLEELLDRLRLKAIQELGDQLRQDRKDLTALMESYQGSKDEKTREALLAEMDSLRQRMQELQRRMNELAKGIRDEHLNEEALSEMMKEQDLGSKLDELERLVKEGKADEALKKMQELAMQMDELLEKLDDAGEAADADADLVLEQMQKEFEDSLEDTTRKQEALAKKTQHLRDKYRAQAKDKIAAQGERLKAELNQRLDELKKDYEALDERALGYRADENKLRALQSADFAKKALSGNDFDLASESADRLVEQAAQLAEAGQDAKRNDEMLRVPPEVQEKSRAQSDKLTRDLKKAEDVAQKLKSLFPRGDQMTPEDQAEARAQQKEQQELEKAAQGLRQKADQIADRAPVLDEEAKQTLEQIQQRMDAAERRLGGRDPARANGDQQAALDGLNGLKQQLQGNDQKGKQGGKKGLMRPMRTMRNRWGKGGPSSEKVELPEEDPNQPPREFRKDVMDAMKQGAPDKYRDQNKRYYEELVK